MVVNTQHKPTDLAVAVALAAQGAMATLSAPALSHIDAAYYQAITRMAEAAKLARMPREQFLGLLKRGVVLQAKQMLASAAARRADKEGNPHLIGYGGARGGGKSHWLICQMAIDDCQRFPGLKCLLLRKSGKAIKEQLKDLLRLLKHVPFNYIESQGMGTVEFPNGSKIVLGHFKDDKDIDGYLGLEYDVIGVEEATTLSKSKVDDILTCLRSSKPGWRPRAYFTTNPGNIGHQWFKKMFVVPYRAGDQAERENGTVFIPATVDDNACVNKEYKKSLTRLTGWKKKAWLSGDWDIQAGQFFTTWKHHAHVWDVAESERGEIPINDSWRVWLSLDYGFTHWTMVYLLAEDGDGNVYVLDEHGARGWGPKLHAGAIKAMLERHGIPLHRIERFVAGRDVFSKDRNGATTAGAYKDEGFKLTAADNDTINGAAEVLARLGDIDQGICNRLFISSRCVRLIETLPALQHDPNCPERVKKWDADEDGEGGDDAYDSFRYGLMAATRRLGGGHNF